MKGAKNGHFFNHYWDFCIRILVGSENKEMIHIVKYDINRVKLENVFSEYKKITELFPDDKFIVLPYGIDILFDVPLEQLIETRNLLNSIIDKRSYE